MPLPCRVLVMVDHLFIRGERKGRGKGNLSIYYIEKKGKKEKKIDNLYIGRVSIFNHVLGRKRRRKSPPYFFQLGAKRREGKGRRIAGRVWQRRSDRLCRRRNPDSEKKKKEDRRGQPFGHPWSRRGGEKKEKTRPSPQAHRVGAPAYRPLRVDYLRYQEKEEGGKRRGRRNPAIAKRRRKEVAGSPLL